MDYGKKRDNWILEKDEGKVAQVQPINVNGPGRCGIGLESLVQLLLIALDLVRSPLLPPPLLRHHRLQRPSTLLTFSDHLSMAPARKRSKVNVVETRSLSEDEGFSDDDAAFASKDFGSDSDEDEVLASGSEDGAGFASDGSQSDSDDASDRETGADIGEEGDEDEEDEDEENDIDEEAEKQYQNLRSHVHSEHNLLENLKRQKDEDASKGQAVKNQMALWDRTLEFRFLLQKAFSNSNKLPKEPLRTSFFQIDLTVDQAYSDLIVSSNQILNSMHELEEALLEKNPLILQGAKGNDKESHQCDSQLREEDDEAWIKLHRINSRIAPFRNESIDKWQRKTQVTTGAAAFKGKLQAFNQNVSEQVAGYMRDPSRMINRMQLRKSSVGIFGKVAEDSKSIEQGVTEVLHEDGDPELLDDSEFYQQLLKEFLESCTDTSSESAFYALRKLQPKKRKIVDRRASKSRKIRYNVHEKIVNFMAPIPMVLSPMAPNLFSNLFGKGNEKSASLT